VWNSAEVPKHGWDDVFNALVAHFTIFTHLRRLLILRHLAGKRACTQDGLVAAVRMSRAATLRHMDKLRRRGVVMAIADSSGAWTLVRNAGPPVRRKLLEIVLHALRAV
jgi:DNA-binding IscR family transcriptional regulator